MLTSGFIRLEKDETSKCVKEINFIKNEYSDYSSIEFKFTDKTFIGFTKEPAIKAMQID